MRKIVDLLLSRAPMVVGAAALALVVGAPAWADEYDDALRCLLLIEFAKADYEAGNVDTLRDAGSFYIAETDRTRPPGLSDQQKLDRFSAVLEAIRAEGGLTSEANRATAIACPAKVNMPLVFP